MMQALSQWEEIFQNPVMTMNYPVNQAIADVKEVMNECVDVLQNLKTRKTRPKSDSSTK